MTHPITIRMGGYGPPTTGFSRSMKIIGDTPATQFGDRIDIKYCWNIMDFGYKAEEILWLVESGMLTLGYQSSSYLTDRVPELSFVDLPFLFETTTRPRRDGRRARPAARAGDREQGELPHPRLVRERLPPHLQPRAHRSARRLISRASPSACCRARSRSAPSSCLARSR